jgi:hypothetical protein
MEDDRAAKAARAKALASPKLTALHIETVAHINPSEMPQMLTSQYNETLLLHMGIAGKTQGERSKWPWGWGFDNECDTKRGGLRQGTS